MMLSPSRIPPILEVLLLLWVALAALRWILIVVARRHRTRRQEEAIRRAARRILHRQKVLFSGRHEIRITRSKAFEGLDLAFYEYTQHRLEDLGFRLLGDLEDYTLNTYRHPRSLPTFFRVLIRPKEAITAGIYHHKHMAGRSQAAGGRPIRRESYVVDLNTALSDGSEVLTSNAGLASKTDEIPGRFRLFLPDGSPPEDLLAAHRGHVASVLADKPGVVPLPVHTIEDCVEQMHKGQDLRVAYHERAGWITREQLFRIGENSAANRETIERVWKEIDQLCANDRLEEESP